MKNTFENILLVVWGASMISAAGFILFMELVNR